MIRVALIVMLLAGVVHADAFTFDGSTRLRGGLLYNLDLDRGLTPSGDALFPIDSSDLAAQSRTVRDLRVRAGITVRSPSETAMLVLGVDLVDGLGGTQFIDAAQRPQAGGRLRLRNAFVTMLTPLGAVVAGRMGNQFGLGMLANSGDCFDCDGRDAADRLGLIVPVRGFYVATSLDVSATTQRVGAHDDELDFDPRNNAHAISTALMRYRGDEVRAIRRRGGSYTFDYGAALSYVWQDRDVPAEYLLNDPGDDAASMDRGLRAFATAGWARLDHARFRIEAEGALVLGSIDQGSPIPGALFRDPVGMRQLGIAMQSELGAIEDRHSVGLDGGFASGDPAPGFGAFPSLANATSKAGDLDGPQARLPMDHRIDNFRFNPDYRVDRILFRQIIGTVTDAVYVRPHARVELAKGITAHAAVIASWAVEGTSTPSGAHHLGVELDAGLAYRTHDGVRVEINYAVLAPGAAFDNTMLEARPAQAIDATLGYAF